MEKLMATDEKPMNQTLATKFLEALEQEQKADVEQTNELLSSLPVNKLVDKGLAVNHLILDGVRSGLGGRMIIDLVQDPAYGGDFKGDVLRVGDVISVCDAKAKKMTEEYTAVVTKVDDKIQAAIDESQEGIVNLEKVYVVKVANTITYKRMESTMRKLSEGTATSSIAGYMLGEQVYTAPQSLPDVSFNDPELNDSQREAIKFALESDISIIHGPPGTGKTYTLVELIKQLYDKGERVLVCGPSNISVDTILERLNKVIPGNELLRIGHPARLLASNLQHSLEVVSRTSDQGLIVKDIRKEIDDTIKDIKKSKAGRKAKWQEIRELRKELRQREKRVTTELILQAKVVVATLHGSSSRELAAASNANPKLFNTLIIDEVSQSLEPQCWIPIVYHDVNRLVLAGDNKQLPPTIKTMDTKYQGVLSTTIFDRLVKMYGEQFLKLLNVQYRMNETIMEFSSQQLYDGKLVAADSVARRTLVDIGDANDDTEVPLIWYDTQGGEYQERDLVDDKDSGDVSSKYNPYEADICLAYIEALLESNIPHSAIGVISPYSAQVSYLKKHLPSGIEISTVDGFQGREKECIILSLVRSNDKFEVGFLRDERRLNVAITRPKRQLCVIGDMETLSRSKVKFLSNWVEWSEENSEIRYYDP